MDKRIAQNNLNFLLSKRISYEGTDIMPLIEIIRELQTEIGDGQTAYEQSGDTQDPAI